MSERMGLLKSIDNTNKLVTLIGYGEYMGEFPKDLDGIEIDTPKVKLDSGKEMWVTEASHFASAKSIENMVSDYKNKGYNIVLE